MRAEQFDFEIVEGRIVEAAFDAGLVTSDAGALLQYAVSQVIGYIKGKSAIHLARVYGERKRNFTGQHFWARGYFVSSC